MKRSQSNEPYKLGNWDETDSENLSCEDVKHP